MPGARHKDAAAIESKAPIGGATSSSPSEPVRRIISEPTLSSKTPKEVLIIASRLKEYIQSRAGMNTSAQVMDVLSDHVRMICDRAIENARAEGRKTVLDRDLQFLKSSK